jgi:hypothetical protein
LLRSPVIFAKYSRNRADAAQHDLLHAAEAEEAQTRRRRHLGGQIEGLRGAGSITAITSAVAGVVDNPDTGRKS